MEFLLLLSFILLFEYENAINFWVLILSIATFDILIVSVNSFFIGFEKIGIF